MSETIFLQQDASEKLIVNILYGKLIEEMRQYFKWRKIITIGRLNTLGTSQRDKFIKHLYNKQ